MGEGPPAILVGGALGDRSAGSSLAAALASRFTVVTYDRRGRGDSGDTPPYAVDREVEDIEALVEDAGGSAFVYGHSSGAVLALEAAARGLAIMKLALYETPFVVDATRPPVPRDYVETITRLVTAGRRGDAVEYFMAEAVGVPRETVARMREAPFWPAMEAVAHTLPYDGAVMGDTVAGDPLPAGRWTSVTMPALVIDGGASPEWARNAVRALAEVLPDARHHTLEGQTHDVDPEVLAPVVQEFFAG